METIKITTTERRLHGKLKRIAVYINGKQRFTLSARKDVNRDCNHDIAALEAARVTAKHWGLLTNTARGRRYRDWELLKLQ